VNIKFSSNCPFDAPEIRSTEYVGDERFAALYNIAPILPGHSLVIPRRHVERVALLGEDELGDLFIFARDVTKFLQQHFNAEGYDWTIQDGRSAGQTIDHVHLHVIPRWLGDLPTPGDWYLRLKLPSMSEIGTLPDSDTRPRLEAAELEKIVSELRIAAVRYGLPKRQPTRFKSARRASRFA
jgi:bis(5'-adenosyl)-triphosphatase